MEFPTSLYKIRLCDGKEYHLFQQELGEILKYNNNKVSIYRTRFKILQEIPINDFNQVIQVNTSVNQPHTTNNIQDFLSLRQEFKDTYFDIQGIHQCNDPVVAPPNCSPEAAVQQQEILDGIKKGTNDQIGNSASDSENLELEEQRARLVNRVNLLEVGIVKLDALIAQFETEDLQEKRDDLNDQLTTLTAEIAEIDRLLNQNPFSFPTQLHEVRLCDNSLAYLLDSELALLPGGYEILNAITISDAQESFQVSINKGSTQTLTGEELLTIRLETVTLTVLEDTPMTENIPEYFIQLPAKLNLVKFCNNETRYLLEDEIAGISGQVSILSEIELEKGGLYSIFCDGEKMDVTAHELLGARHFCTDLIIESNNCQLTIENTTENCTYEFDIKLTDLRPIANTPNIMVSYDNHIASVCGNGEKEEIIESKQVELPANRYNSYTNAENSSSQPIPLINGGYFQALPLESNNGSSLSIDLNPETVLSTYPALINVAGFNKTHLYHLTSAPERMEAAIETVVATAIQEWNPSPNIPVLYEMAIEIANGYFAIRFYIFHAPQSSYLNLSCSPKGGILVYVPNIKEPENHHAAKRTTGQDLTLLTDSYITKCGNLTGGIDIEITGNCNTLTTAQIGETGKIQYNKLSKNPETQEEYVYLLECPVSSIIYGLACDDPVATCKDGNCTPCTDGPNPTPTPPTEYGPCGPQPPICTAQQTAAQAAQVADVLAQIETLDPNQLEYPTVLVQIALCDGSTAYILEDYLNAIDNFTVVSTITIQTATDVFTVITYPENDLFGMHLNYYTGSAELQAEPYSNGNVSWMKWKVGNQAQQQYGFRYDELDRIKNAYYQAQYTQLSTSTPPPGTVASLNLMTIHQNRYNLFDVNYAGDGSITGLKRNGFVDCQQSLIDDLTYRYGDGDPSGPSFPSGTFAPNQLSGVSDDSQPAHGFKNGNSSYRYDANGNLISDTGKNIAAINYNFLNLPRQIQTAQGDLKIWYDATGAKQKKEVTGANGYTKEYANGVEYKDGELEAIYTADGRIIYEEWDDPKTEEIDIVWRYRYEFTLSDHLGNARVTFSDLDDDGFITLADNPATEDYEEPVEMLQENHYYPFGMNMEGSWTPQIGVKNMYQFNGIEKNEDLRINLSLAEFRSYDAAIGRWVQIDPLAELAFEWTPYRFGFNNPIIYADTDGLFETEGEAKKHAKDKGIYTGWFAKNKVKEQKDGTWAIENNKEHTSTQNLGGELGVMTSSMVTANDIMVGESVSNKGIGFRDGTKLNIETPAFFPLPFGGAAQGGFRFLGSNLNSNGAVAKFATYWFKVAGKTFKIGKAHAGRITKSSGLPTRVHTQLRKLIKKHGKNNVDVTVSQLGKTTTKEAKRVESSILKKIFKRTGKVPPGNTKSFKPK